MTPYDAQVAEAKTKRERFYALMTSETGVAEWSPPGFVPPVWKAVAEQLWPDPVPPPPEPKTVTLVYRDRETLKVRYVDGGFQHFLGGWDEWSWWWFTPEHVAQLQSLLPSSGKVLVTAAEYNMLADVAAEGRSDRRKEAAALLDRAEVTP